MIDHGDLKGTPILKRLTTYKVEFETGLTDTESDLEWIVPEPWIKLLGFAPFTVIPAQNTNDFVSKLNKKQAFLDSLIL